MININNHKWLVLLLVFLLVPQAYAGRPRTNNNTKLKAPSSPKRTIRVKTPHHSRYKRHGSRHRNRVHHYRNPIVIIIRQTFTQKPKTKSKPYVAPRPRHKTIFIRSGYDKPRSRNQVLKESRERAKSKVYNKDGRKR